MTEAAADEGKEQVSTMLRYTTEGTGEKILQVVGAISLITERDYDDPTMLANYSLQEIRPMKPEEIVTLAREVKADVKDITGREGMYMNGMIDAFEMFARILAGEKISYRDAIRVMQQIELRPIPQDCFDRLTEAADRSLTDLGYKGTVGEKAREWLSLTALDGDKVSSFSKALIDQAKKSTEKLVVKMAQGDGIGDVKTVRGVFWSGNSKYLGGFLGQLTFNIDKPWSVPTFANILCHEAYPGHQAFYSHWDDLYLQGLLPLEGSFYSTAGNPANPMFEGTPECGLHFLGWDDFRMETPEIMDEQKTIYAAGRDVLDLQRLYQQQAAWLYHVEGASKEDVAAFMMQGGLFRQVEAENTIRFMTHPVQMYYYPSYYYGHWLVYELYEAMPVEKRQAFFRLLYDRPHTNETLIMEASSLAGRQLDPLAKW